MRLSLRTKLLGLSLLLAVGPLSLAALFTVRWLSADKESFVYQLEGFAALAAAREVEDNLQSASRELGQIALLSADPRIPPEERRRLAAQLFGASGFLAVSANAAGREVLSARDDDRLGKAGDAGRQLVPDPAWAPADGTLLVRNVSPSGAVPAVAIARIVSNPGGPPISAAAVVPAASLLDTEAWSSPYETFVVDGDGRLLVHPEGTRVAAREDLSGLEAVRRLREGGAGATGYGTPAGRVLGGYAPVRSGRLGVVLQIPEEAVTEAVGALVRNAAALIALMLAASVALAVLLARSVAGPVGTLTAAAGALARGDFGARLPPAGPDEIGQLAAAFARMRTDLELREKQLKEAQESLVQSEKMGALGQLAAGITHEVKNPLAGIIGFAQLCLKLAPEGSPLIPHLQLIEKEGKRSRDILENLLRFARKEDLALEERDAGEVVAAAHRLVAHQLQLAKVKVATKLGKDLPKIRVNETQLQQVLMNLMLNAMHAMQPKGGTLELATGRAPDGRVVISVKDEGHGIKEADRKKLFTPFFTTKEKGKGTGLGLSVSYGIVKDHGGELKVWSQEGVGTVFYVYLPAAGEARAA